MREHVTAIKAALAPLGYPVHFVAVPGDDPAYPYVLLWTSAGVPSADLPVCDEATDLDDTVGVTGVGLSAEAVLAVLGRVRGVLSPSGGAGALTVPDRAAWLRLRDSRPVQADRDVTVSGTNQHPFFGVDLYRLVSTPA